MLNLLLKILLTAQIAIAISHAAHANESINAVEDAVSIAIQKTYPNARIELTSAIQWSRGARPEEFRTVKLRGENSAGQSTFAVVGAQLQPLAEGVVSFSAWMPARIAMKRILPGQMIQADLFKVQELDVAVGMAREFRGILMSPEEKLERLETKQTILENQPLTSTAIQRTADIRRGDAVRIRVISNGLELSTQGLAQEPAFLNGSVRVMTGKSKRELVGKLKSDGAVEVIL